MCWLVPCILLAVATVKANQIHNDTLSLPSNGDKIPINKCCPFHQYMGRKKACVNYTSELYITNVSIYDEAFRKTEKSFEDIFELKPNKLKDQEFKNHALDTHYLDFNIYLIENGVLQLELPNAYNRWNAIAKENYCIDYRILKNKSLINKRFWVVLPDNEPAASNPYLTYATFISCFFMILVLIVYAMLPELRNLCGMILMAYVASLFMAFLLLAIIQIKIHHPTTCIGLTMGIYYFFLAAFCWMSVMSYDIWWTFRGYAKARPIHRRGENFKFLMYCLYAWGVPLLMTIALALLNTYTKKMKHLPWFVTPHVPDYGCFLEGGVKLLYLYMPMLILILCNWIFYLMTAFNIWRLSRGTAVLDSAAAGNPQAHRTHRHRFMVYLKLSVVMGLNWVLEIVSFLYPDFSMWYLSDAYNILIGLAIFLIFVCKKKILKKLCKRYLGRNTMRWYPSSKSYSSSTSDSNNETMTLQSKVSSQPNGLNGYIIHNRIKPEY
ncbi:G-protein coupled receptor Mth2 [Helicoverpa armigera]|uniref:G-protein coupled receptor Mth2 n=1 Tax=Helicoverpa armigera TaxID=29058 RepID=UPI0030837F83